MSIITPICNCTTLRNIIVSFTPPTPRPAEGYVVRWRSIIDDSVIPNIVSAYTVTNVSKESLGIVTIGPAPRCCKIEVDVTASCGFNQYGVLSSTVIAPNVTYAAQFSVGQFPCNAVNGIYTVNIDGTPGQMLRLRLNFGGTIQRISTNGVSAYLYGEIRTVDGSAMQSSNSNITLNTNPFTTSLLVAPEIGGLVIPLSGSLAVQTTLVGYNVENLTNTQATITVVSIDGNVVNNISHPVPCKLVSIIP